MFKKFVNFLRELFSEQCPPIEIIEENCVEMLKESVDAECVTEEQECVVDAPVVVGETLVLNSDVKQENMTVVTTDVPVDTSAKKKRRGRPKKKKKEA